ncbi:MAG TPA: hypothetical protein VJS92_02415, partial [Candidatus Polarisedimenticolaceae bacterium]|nr:hypothetical protein [Candidatus Polarisedimenticolaceae bacterium]
EPSAPVAPAALGPLVVMQDGHALELPAASVDALVRAVVARLSDGTLRALAEELVPELAERLVRERIRELESGES